MGGAEKGGWETVQWGETGGNIFGISSRRLYSFWGTIILKEGIMSRDANHTYRPGGQSFDGVGVVEVQQRLLE